MTRYPRRLTAASTGRVAAGVMRCAVSRRWRAPAPPRAAGGARSSGACAQGIARPGALEPDVEGRVRHRAPAAKAQALSADDVREVEIDADSHPDVAIAHPSTGTTSSTPEL